jgi:2-oxo-4-hydroxy-4-carboxy-5-ureidoimidazoline decarboxylase
MMPALTIEDLNLFGRDAFVKAVGWVFEDSPWVADRAWERRPFADLDGLQEAMIKQVEQAPPGEQLELLRAHPDLATRSRVTSASSHEQAGAGLDHLTPEEFKRLARMNSEYRGKFGFPFLFAVKGSTKYDILQALEQRLESSRDAEYQEALRQVYRIAGFRLRDIFR